MSGGSSLSSLITVPIQGMRYRLSKCFSMAALSWAFLRSFEWCLKTYSVGPAAT